MRSGNCQLQTIANDLGILTVPYETQLPKGLRGAWTTTFPLYHDYNKCIKCMRCVQVCDKVQSLSIWDVAGTGGRTTVDVSNNRVIKDSDCALCGQCITHCPVGGLRERDDTQKAFAALADPEKICCVSIMPCVAKKAECELPTMTTGHGPDVQTLYSEFLGAPLSEKAEELLHTEHEYWAMPN